MENNKKKILIADDEIHILNLVKLILGDEYEYIEASNGKEVLKILETEKPDLIILDAMMPEMNGYSACKKIKSNPKTKSIPVAMLSAKSDEQDILYGVESGADVYFSKPIKESEFIETIKSLIG